MKGLNETLVQAYHSFQIDLAVLYGADRKDAEREMADVLNFEINFAKVRLHSLFLLVCMNIVSFLPFRLH